MYLDPNPGGAAPPSEEELGELRSVLSRLTAAMPQVFFMVEIPTLRPLFVSLNFEALTGRRVQAFYAGPSSWGEIVHPDDLSLLTQHPGQAARADRPTLLKKKEELSLRIVKADGRVRRIRVTSFPLHDGKGAIYRRAGIVEDITERYEEEDIVRRSAELHEAMLSSTQIGVVVFDRELRCRAWNPYFAEISGVPASLVLGRAPSFPNSIVRRLIGERAGLERVLSGQESSTGPVLIGAPNQIRPRWLDVTYGPLRNQQGEIIGVLGIGREVTEQVLAEDARLTSEQNFRNLTEQLPDGIAVFQKDSTVYVNQRLAQLLGYEHVSELLDRSIITTLFPVEDRQEILAMCRCLPAGGRPQPPWDCRLMRQDGSLLHAECRLASTVYDHQLAHLLTVRDLSDRDQAEALRLSLEQEREQRVHLKAALGQVHGLSRRLVAAQESQTRRLSRELHDDIGQLMTALKMSLDRLQPSSLAAAERETLDRARQITLELLERVRRLARDLRPTLLDDLGLLPALRWLFERMQETTGLHVTLLTRRIERRFPAEHEITIYRILQECINNVVRHADVEAATVRLWYDGLKLGAQVEDHGKGFVPAAAMASGLSLGLSSMCERARQVGGECVVDSAPGRGTRITVELPLHEPEQEEAMAAGDST